MKINGLQIQNSYRNNISKSNKEMKEFHCANLDNYSTNLTSNYNISFHGLFKKKDEAPIFQDARVQTTDIEMVPNQEYLINADSLIKLADKTIDLYSEKYRNKIASLKNGESFVIGREGFGKEDLSNFVSKNHLRITKRKNGELTACDLGSINKSKILSNVYGLDTSKTNNILEPNKFYLLPINSYIKLGNTVIDLQDLQNPINNLKDNESIIIGREAQCTVSTNDNSISKQHLEVKKYGNSVLVKDLHSTNGSIFIGLSQQRQNGYIDDFSQISTRTTLRRGIKTKVPNNSQIYIGHNFTIDLRNKNILAVLNEKGSIKIGRNPSCDIVIPEFYAFASREHLLLTKCGDEITATDLNSTNTTEVIPAKEVKAFYEGAKEIELGQANIGDCYLLSTIHALSKNKLGAQLLEKMVQVDENGNYIVSFFNEKPIIVKPEELDGQKRNNEEKQSVSGDLGVKAIERAYAKKLNRYSPSGQTMFLKIDKGGFPTKALKDLCGIKFRNHVVLTTNIPELLRGITVLGRENYLVNCTTPNKVKHGSFVDKEKRFIKAHAYSVGNINRDTQTIEIINPHNTRNRNIISWDEFSKYFDNIYVAKMN